jgi:peptidyl-prolyl cis-trans isomerase A (cyclophilin A)
MSTRHFGRRDTAPRTPDLGRRGAAAILLAAAGAALLAGCGGGGDDGALVSNISASNARFASTATIAVAGLRLDEGITVGVEGPCQNLTPVVGGTTEGRQYTCNVTEIGPFIVTVTSAGGSVIGRLTVDVPKPRVTVTTTLGTFALELDPVAAPRTVRNFLGYVNANFYNQVIVHAAIPNRGIISGGYRTQLRAKPGTAPAIPLESNNGLKNVRGTIGMLRGAEPNTARAQWYVNTVDNPDLDFVSDQEPGFAVFGTVVSGLEVVDAITAVPTRADTTTGLTNVPVTDVIITDASQTR